MPDGNTEFLKGLTEMNGGKANVEPTPEEGKIQYTSHPIVNLRIGKDWIFKNGLLTLESEEEEQKFLDVINHKKFPPRERAGIKKLDYEAATRIAKENIAKSRARVTQTIDSTAGERPDNSPKVGTGDLLGDATKLGIQAAAEGGREQNVPGAPDSNRETQTEPSPQPHPEQPFRAETQGAGGQASAEQLAEETGGAADAEQLAQGNANDKKAEDAATESETKPAGPFANLKK